MNTFHTDLSDPKGPKLTVTQPFMPERETAGEYLERTASGPRTILGISGRGAGMTTTDRLKAAAAKALEARAGFLDGEMGLRSVTLVIRVPQKAAPVDVIFRIESGDPE